jgi:endonuclease YncB( thermonuclease family)
MRVRILLPIAALAISLVCVPSASAARVPCVVGTKAPKCKVWTAKAKFAADGDTFRPKIKEGKKWSKKTTVRMTGIQAPELSSYSRAHGRKGNCLGVEAAETLEKLIKRKTIRLVAMKGGSTTAGGRARLRRTVQVKKGGKWIDPAMVLLEKGLVLWLPNGSDEWAWNGAYARIAEEAQARGVGLWNPEACDKPGPSASSPLSLKVKWDAEGTDSNKTANGEWVRIKNDDLVNPVPLNGWTLRDSDLRGQKMESGYRFPANAVIPAGGSIKVHLGGGQNGDGKYYWGENKVIFDNATSDKKQMGDGAYLFDPHSELRAYVMYPCRTTCADPLDGKVSVTARYMGIEHEWITITNRSAEWLSLNEYEIENVPYFFEFGARDVLAPNKAITLWLRKPHDVPADVAGRKLLVTPAPGLSLPGLTDFASASAFLSWGFDKGVLADDGDVVVLRNPQGTPVAGACDFWGGFRCPSS